jgi:cysteine synthase A
MNEFVQLELIEKLDKLLNIEKSIKNSSIVSLQHTKLNLYAKLEFQLFGASTKIRPAFLIMKSAIERGLIDLDTTIIESSSGNFAIAMAMLCRVLNLKFIAVIDKNANRNANSFLKFYAHDVVVINEPDERGGYLLNRLEYVKNYIDSHDNVYCPNQYKNMDSMYSHYYGTGGEIVRDIKDLDYIFIAAGTCGSLAGISRRVKKHYKNIKVIAVDVVGSIIFGGNSKKRYIPGMGSSLTPDLLKYAKYDEIIYVNEENIPEGCYGLFDKHYIFGGGSSGTVYYAIEKYFEDKQFDKNPNVLFLCPDGGRYYLETIYNKAWVKNTFEKENK